MKYKAVIFDLDGTLLDTLDDLADGVNHALSKHGLPVRTREEIRTFVGNGVANLISKSVPSGTDSDTTSQVLATFKPYYAEHARCKTKPYDGIIELIDFLNKENIKMAIVSNKFHNAVAELNKFYFGDRIETAIGETPELQRKPNPDTVLKALGKLGISPSEAVYVGDSSVDILTAQNAGTDCISVSWGFRSRENLLENGATKIADTVKELSELLK